MMVVDDSCVKQRTRSPSLRVGGRLALLYIHQMNRVNSRDDLCHDHHHHHFRLIIMVDKRSHTMHNKNKRKMVRRPTRYKIINVKKRSDTQT